MALPFQLDNSAVIKLSAVPFTRNSSCLLYTSQPQVIAGFREDVVEVLEPSEIYRVFAESGKVFAETNHGEYALRLRLYMQTIVYQCDTAMPAQKLPNC